MYSATDPRASLAPAAAAAKPAATRFGVPYYGKFYQTEPDASGPLHRTWYTRGQTFLAGYTEAQPGHAFSRVGQPDEYALIVPESGAEIAVTWSGKTTIVRGPSVVFVPAGDSRVEVTGTTRLASFFTTKSADLVALCSNSAGYVEDPNVPAITPWPDPVDGFRVRSYSLDFPIAEGGFGRLFRCTTFMVNYFDARNGPRDASKLSPHDHDDFQQCSLILDGDYVHHMRWPWTTDRNQWRPDVHEPCGAPSVTFIPAGALHTSEAVGPSRNLLIDVFGPPRFDFSNKPGWVHNAADYPAP